VSFSSNIGEDNRRR